MLAVPAPAAGAVIERRVPAAARTAADRALERAAYEHAAAAADRAGIDRRRFLQTSAGVAAVLTTFNLAACSSGDGGAAPTTTRRATTTTGDPGGTFDVPPAEDVEACEEALAGDELIFDIHTHHVVPDGPWRQNAVRIADMILGLVPAGCAETDPYRCLDRTAYLHDMFLASDTTMSLLSDVPNSGPMDAPMPWEEKRETKQLADSLAVGGQPRVLLHDVLAPNFGDLAMRLDEMEVNAASGDVSAFKVYTAWGPDQQGFALDDPAIGLPVIEKARELGVKVICAHKGLPLLEFDRAHNGPEDIVAVAKQYPDMDFIVYHGAYELQTTEGPYDPADAALGVNSLIKAMDDHGIPPNANVHAELGTTWRETLSSPTEAAHVLGKLLTRVGADNVMWGTDAVWYGSPQPQIMAFRAFQIAPELQERFGYPSLTPEVKAKIFGLNAARVFGVDPEGIRCAIDEDGLSEARAQLASYRADGAIDAWQARGPLSRSRRAHLASRSQGALDAGLIVAIASIERGRPGKASSVPKPKGVVMSVLRTRDRDDAVVDRTEGRDATTVSGTSRTTQRFWTFAPGQVVSLIVGVGFVIVGVLAVVRAGLDGSLATPVVEVLGYTHTAWLGVAEIGLGLLLVLAGTGAWGRPLSVLLGAAMVIAGVLVLAETSQMPEELGLEEAYGWPLVILGALVALAALALPVWRTQHHDRDTVDLRDGDREVVRR